MATNYDLSHYERETLREEFEENAKRQFNWGNFMREGDKYQARMVQAMWVGIKYGYIRGREGIDGEKQNGQSLQSAG